jgi:hypothetical protein
MHFFTIKPTKCTNFTDLFWYETLRFGQFLFPLSGVYSLYTQQWYMSYRFVDSFRAGPGPARKLRYAPAAFTHQERFVLLIFVKGWFDPKAKVRPEGPCQWRIPMTTSWIEPATFRLVAQCLKQLRHRLPLVLYVDLLKALHGGSHISGGIRTVSNSSWYCA